MIYGLLVGFVRTFNWMTGHKTIRHGDRRLPAKTGAVLAINHTSYVDFTYIGVDAKIRDKRFIRFMGKIELRNNPVLRWLMWGCQVIPVDRSAGADAYRAAVDELRKGEIVGIYPEATISRSFEIKTFKWGSQRIATKGLPRHLGRTKTPVMVSIGDPIPPDGTADELTATLHTAMSALLLEVQDAYGTHPAGENWVPDRLGGSAPTLEEAAAMDPERQ